MEVEEALNAILMDIDGYLGVDAREHEHFKTDLRRYLTYVRAAGYAQGDDDATDRANGWKENQRFECQKPCDSACTLIATAWRGEDLPRHRHCDPSLARCPRYGQEALSDS